MKVKNLSEETRRNIAGFIGAIPIEISIFIGWVFIDYESTPVFVLGFITSYITGMVLSLKKKTGKKLVIWTVSLILLIPQMLYLLLYNKYNITEKLEVSYALGILNTSLMGVFFLLLSGGFGWWTRERLKKKFHI